jgi:hypothetical protein
MKVANIISTELINHEKLDYINYYNGCTDYLSIDNGLPTLYVGWTFMKSCDTANSFINNANILNKCIISDKLYWEFSFDENKSEHINGVKDFSLKCPELYLMSKYNYVNIDPTFENITRVEDLLNQFRLKLDGVYKYKNESIYILIGRTIYGLNLKQLQYLKFDIDLLVTLLKEKSLAFNDDIDGNLYMEHYKIFSKFELLKRFIVTFIAK